MWTTTLLSDRIVTSGQGKQETDRRGSRIGRAMQRAAIAFGLVFVGCFGTANMVPKDSNLAPEDVVRIEAGRGISFVSLDGAPVHVPNIRALPGTRSLRIEVRRQLKSLDKEKLAGIYEIGSCRLEFEARPGGRYEVLTRVFAQDRYRVVADQQGEDGEQRIVGLTVHVLDLDTGEEFRAPPEACVLEVDCRRIDRFRAKSGSECTFDGRLGE